MCVVYLLRESVFRNKGGRGGGKRRGEITAGGVGGLNCVCRELLRRDGEMGEGQREEERG